jgi:hypothetical protein
MLDVSVSYNKYKFLGYEFLTWLWFMMESEQKNIKNIQKDIVEINIGNRLVLENRHTGAVETVTIKGDDAGLEEARLALKKGALVSEMNMFFKLGEQKWQFTLKGESFHISTLKIPETGPVEKEEDWEGAVLEKIFLYEKAITLVRALYQKFIKLRIIDEYTNNVIPKINNWISGSKI